jgi:hypothetical protein
LCIHLPDLDTLALGSIIVLTGGLASPLMSGTFCMLFFSSSSTRSAGHPSAAPPSARHRQNRPTNGHGKTGRDLLLLLWYSGLDLIIVYVVCISICRKLAFPQSAERYPPKSSISSGCERQRMAREMHDGLGAILSAVKNPKRIRERTGTARQRTENRTDECSSAPILHWPNCGAPCACCGTI